MQQVRLVLVGGFLGAGKTTLLARTAEHFAAQGKRVGLITNDQAANLVDTAILKAVGPAVQEVSGGCFCCRFEELVTAARELVAEHQPDLLIGEPVGSCTDLSATVLQPLKEGHGELFRVAPFSVLVDVSQMRTLNRMRDAMGKETPKRFADSVLYIYRKQLEEADLIVLNKVDTLEPDEVARLEQSLTEQFPGVPHLTISALTGQGMDAWLDYVLDGAPAGQRIAQVDYDVYAEGEAVLGWLNASFELRGPSDPDWPAFCLDLVERTQRECRTTASEIAHLKLRLETGGGSISVSLTANDGTPQLRSNLSGASGSASLLVNARVQMEPDRLRAMIEETLAAAAGEKIVVTLKSMENFSPARPQPTHRFGSVV